MGTLKPVSGTALPIQALPTALQSAGVPALMNNVPIFQGLDVKNSEHKQWQKQLWG